MTESVNEVIQEIDVTRPEDKEEDRNAKYVLSMRKHSRIKFLAGRGRDVKELEVYNAYEITFLDYRTPNEAYTNNTEYFLSEELARKAFDERKNHPLRGWAKSTIQTDIKELQY